MTVRRASLLIHRWLGLGVGALVALLGVTGSVLVYGDAIDRALNPGLLVVEPVGERAPPGEALRVARARLDGLEARSIGLPFEPDGPYVVYGAVDGEQIEAYVDPYRETLLGTRPHDSGFVGTTFALHAELLGGEAGHQVVGWLGVVLLILAVTGIVVWWPRLARLGRAVWVRWSGSGRRVNYDLHRAAGFWTSAYLIVLAATGAGLVFYGPVGSGLNAVTGSESMAPPPTTVETPVRDPVAAIDRGWGAATSALPDARFSFVSLPGEETGPIAFRGKRPAELHPNGRSYVWTDGAGRVVRVADATAADVGPRILHALWPVHIGVFSIGPIGPDAVRAVWAALGLAPLGLGITGFLVWWLRRRREAGASRASRARREREVEA
ncbi:MAG: PepSY-associated TM helix domain-containing protein [Gemmatimonadota bacterium]|nr:PepSY-associated TM helix domain-containing protein [Gemmatimonadota bacterium]